VAQETTVPASAHGEDLAEDGERRLGGRVCADIEAARAEDALQLRRRDAHLEQPLTPECLVTARAERTHVERVGVERPLDRGDVELVVVRQDDDGAPLWTCSVLTTSAPDELGEIHDRTPLLVPRADWPRWLDPEVPDPGEDLLVPGTPGVLDAWPVDPAVGNVHADGPQLVARVQAPPTLLEG
jgi:hypothetical protein